MYYHTMLGHFGKKATISTLKKITDILIGDVNSMDFNKFCHECTAGKMKNVWKGCGRIHVVDKPKYPGQIISMDFQGPFPKTPSGLRYVLTAIDHHSSHGWVKRKDNTYEEVTRILKDLSAKSGYVGTIMAHMDNKLLWTCDTLADVLKENKAILRGSIPVRTQVQQYLRTVQPDTATGYVVHIPSFRSAETTLAGADAGIMRAVQQGCAEGRQGTHQEILQRGDPLRGPGRDRLPCVRL
jgi:hypothetical protein